MVYISLYVSEMALKEMRNTRDQSDKKGITLFDKLSPVCTDEELIQLFMFYGLSAIESRLRDIKEVKNNV